MISFVFVQFILHALLTFFFFRTHQYLHISLWNFPLVFFLAHISQTCCFSVDITCFFSRSVHTARTPHTLIPRDLFLFALSSPHSHSRARLHTPNASVIVALAIIIVAFDAEALPEATDRAHHKQEERRAHADEHDGDVEVVLPGVDVSHVGDEIPDGRARSLRGHDDGFHRRVFVEFPGGFGDRAGLLGCLDGAAVARVVRVGCERFDW